MQKELEGLRKQLEVQGSKLTDEARADLIETIDIKDTIFQRFQQDTQKDIDSQAGPSSRTRSRAKCCRSSRRWPRIKACKSCSSWTLPISTPMSILPWSSRDEIIKAYNAAYPVAAPAAAPVKK